MSFSSDQVDKALNYINSKYEIDGGHFELAGKKRHSEALMFFKDVFLLDEPISRSIGLSWSREFAQWIMQLIRENLSLMVAANATGEIMGILVIRKLHQSKSDNLELETLEDKQLQKLFAFFQFLDEKSAFYKRYSGTKAYELFAVAVSSKYRDRSMGSKILGGGVDFLKSLEKEHFVIRGTGTSRFSQRICEKLGFQTLYQIDYNDYIVDGKAVIQNTGEHKKTVVFTLPSKL